MNYDARNEFKPFARKAEASANHPRKRVGQTQKDRLNGRKRGPNVRVQGSNDVIYLASGGTVRVSDSGRKNGNGVFFRVRDGACVSHKIAGK